MKVSYIKEGELEYEKENKMDLHDADYNHAIYAILCRTGKRH